MGAGDRPVRNPRRAERTPVADAVAQNPPHERQLVAVLPRDLGHFPIVMRLLPPHPEHTHGSSTLDEYRRRLRTTDGGYGVTRDSQTEERSQRRRNGEDM